LKKDNEAPRSELNLLTLSDKAPEVKLERAAMPSGGTEWAFGSTGEFVYADSVDASQDAGTNHVVLKRAFQVGSAWQATPVFCHGPCTALAVSKDGHSIAVGEDRAEPILGDNPPDAGHQGSSTVPEESSVVVWSNGVAERPLRHHGSLRALAFSNRGDMLASADADAVHVWDLKSKPAISMELARFPYDGSVREVGFSVDDRSVLIVGTNQVDAFRFRSADILVDACARVGRNLTIKEWDALALGEKYDPVCPTQPAR